MEAVDILDALESRIAVLPGGRDKEKRPLVLVQAPTENYPWSKDNLDEVLKYFNSIFSPGARQQGLTVIVDAQKSSWRLVRPCTRQVSLALGSSLACLLVLRPDAFWDKQRVDNCARIHKDGEPVYIPLSRLCKYVDTSQLPEELGGSWCYSHDGWIQNRVHFEEFAKGAERIVSELERLRQRLGGGSNGASPEMSSAEDTLYDSSGLYTQTREMAAKVLREGQSLMERLDREYGSVMPQDMTSTKERAERLLEIIEGKLQLVQDAWLNVQKNIVDAKEMHALEDGVQRVTEWILGPGEAMLNSQQDVGYDITSAEELRRQHEALELQCRETYGHYAELLHKIDSVAQDGVTMPEDLRSLRDFMDFVCRSFATRLERRRNVLITSARFFRLVTEYFQVTSEVYESLVMCSDLEALDSAHCTLLQLQDSQLNIDMVEKELVREGEKLSDLLSMPVKDALGRELDVDYTSDIVNVREVLDMTTARRQLFRDSVELQRLTLQQAAHIHDYEKDAAQAVEWLNELFQVMLKTHSHVGCNVCEIQLQKDELQTFQETAKGTYEYGCQLVNVALSLRQSCKLPAESNTGLSHELWRVWKRLYTVGQEQMTRLRVSAVFHRSVSQHCKQLSELKAGVAALSAEEDSTLRQTKLRRVLAARERLLLEVGRMVRLGRLLKTRLREPLSTELEVEEGNVTAVEVISERLAEVTSLAEELDAALCGGVGETTSFNMDKILDGTASTTPEDWYNSLTKSSSKTSHGTEDSSKSEEEFVTASECTCTPPSRSSSFHTASEGEGGSPWWEVDPSDQEHEQAKEQQASKVVVQEVTETRHLKLSRTEGCSITTTRSVREYIGNKPEGDVGQDNVKEHADRVERESIEPAVEPEPPLEPDTEIETANRLTQELSEHKEWLELRVVELTPGLTLLGTTLAEATAMLEAHLQVLDKIHSKQSPVEELLRQADQLIARQHTRAEVYNAMAESLSIAWQDVNSLLQRRKEILELNVKYHSDAAVCLERTCALELACSGAPLPVQVSDLRELLNHLSEVKRSMLEALMAALQDGRALLDLLRQLAAEGTLDSRPSQVLASTQSAISQVERWLEDLHDRRRALECSWQARKTELEQCLALALLTTDLRMLEEIYADRLDSLGRHHAELGDSESSATLLLSEYDKLLPEAKELQDQGLKILRATEQLAATGHFAGEDAIAQAYQLLSTSTEYLEKLERREHNLRDAITFFTDAQTALLQLADLERELSPGITASELSSVEHSANEVCSPVVTLGYQILEVVPGAKGVQNKVEELENHKLKLCLAVSTIQEEKLKSTQALNHFLEKQNQLYLWLVNTAEAFINGHQDMGSVLAVAKDFLQLHHKMLNDLQMKGTEINALLSTVPDLLLNLDESNRADVENKAEALRNRWSTQKQVLEKRSELATQYVKFHSLIVELATHVDSLTERLNGRPAPSERGDIEEQFASVTQIYSQLGNVGDNFKQDSIKAPEPLDVERARLCVDTLHEHFTARVTGLRELREEWERRLDADRHTAQRWADNMASSQRTVDWVSKLDSQLYPVMADSVDTAKATVRDLEGSRDRVLSEVKRAQDEVQLRITTADEILAQGGVDQRDNEVLSQLKALQERLQQVVTDYQVLVQMFITFFRNLSELEHTVQGLEGQYDGLLQTTSPTTLAEVEKALREHDASRQAIQELFKFAQTESQQLIARIRQQEPDRAAEKDTEQVARSLERLRSAWERAWTQHRMALESQQQLAQFDSDLGHIHGNLDELSQQLAKVKGQYGENLAAAKATSLAFHYFEKTIELLEQRIETFMGAGDAMLKSKHSSSPHIQHELLSLRTRWHQFHLQVNDTRSMIDLSLQYFALIEEAEDWFREGSRLLMTIAKRSSTIRTPEEANELLQEIELFLKPGESKQDERIQKISQLAIKLYGGGQPDHLSQVKSESREMIDSFSQVSLELQQIINFLNKPPEEQQKEIVGLQEALPIEEPPTRKSPSPPIRKSPSPPLKKVKLGEPEPQPPNFSLPLHDATIDEGSRFTFECRVTGIPKPEICWLKDNISIGSNLDYHTRAEEDGLCSLTIEETFTEDSACFTCRATNILGYAETTALLTVRENERESAPVFVRPLAPLVTQEGSPVSLVCLVEGTPLPTVQWFRDGVCVDAVPRYTITYNNGEAVLTLDQVARDDQGLFSCKATNRLGSETTAASLSVQPKISETAPAFITPLSNVMARAGQKLKLECEISGSPEPRVEWSHNGKLLPETRDIKVQYQSGKLVLTVPEAFPKDAGTYSLTATNSAGSITGSCTVTVKGRLPTETSDSELASDLEPTKPSIPTPLKDSAVFEGGRARMECVIVGQPEPEVIWYHEGVPVKESKEVQLLFQGDRCSLVIAETLPEDAGRYKVVAINSAGEASSSCHLTVQKSGGELEQPPPPPVELEPCGLKPLFISLLTDILASEGDAVTLECAVRGDPTPAVSWFLNNNPLQPSDRIKTEQDGSGLCTLTINPVTAEDKGNYTARATNSLGEAKCFSHLIVKNAANLTSATAPAPPTEEPRSALTIPAFTELFADRSVILGTSTKFECIVTGRPTPKVRWLFNDAPVSGSQFLPSVSGSRQVLTIPTVAPELVGKVTCTAENEAGRASCTANLTVSDAPPVDDLLQTIDQLNMSETKVFEMKREVFMQSSTHSQQVMGGGEPVVQVHGVASRHEHTSKQIGDKPAVETESHKTSEYHNVGGVEEKIDSQSQSATVVPPGAVVPTRPAMQRKQVPPRFITPVMGKIVDQGVDVTLECILEGYPSPDVTWMKNGQPVVEGGRSRTTWELNKARLQLERITVDDAGKYSCTAVNPAGSATCTADLVVKKNVFPPVFGRRLRADTVLVGKRAVLEVEVTGTPEPTITWYKDGQQIASSSSMFRVLAQGNSHRLIIEQATHSHSGRYEVRAANDGGEARSAADLLITEPLEPQLTLSTGMEMDLFQPSDLSSSKHTVSVTESFKSDKKVSIHVEQSTAPFDLDLPTLSIKPIELPASTISEKFMSLSKREEKETVFKPMQEPVLLPPITTLTTEEDTPVVNESIEDSSITKKSALSFFKNIIKENEEEAKATKQFEPTKKPLIPEPLPIFEPSLPPFYFESQLPEPMSFTQSILQESSQKFESVYTSDGLVLHPEPPPEIGFISKSHVVKGKEEISEKVKKLEESHKAIPESQIPSGAVRIFPTPQKVPSESISTQTKVFSHPMPNTLSESISSQTSFQKTFVEPAKPPLVTESSVEAAYTPIPYQRPVAIPPPVQFKVTKFEIPQKSEPFQSEVTSETFSSFQSNSSKTEILNGGDFVTPKFDSLGPIVRPSAGIQVRPQSPRPSAEGVSMEKLWSTKQKEEIVEFPHYSPVEFFAPVIESNEYKSEEFKSYKEIKQTASPLPSATGLAMEKLWTPSIDQQRPLSSLSIERPKSALSDRERPKSPSAEGLAMDKMWAHKVSTQKKMWPPTQPKEEPQVTPPWTHKSDEALPSKSADSSSQISMQKESFTENNVKYESQSFSKVESSSFSTSNFSENLSKSESAFKEFKPVKPYIPPPIAPPESKIIYVAEAHASHTTKIPEMQPLVTESSFMTSSQTYEKMEKTMTDSSVVEERVLRPSEALKLWPPPPKEEKQELISSFDKQEIRKEFSSTIASNSALNDIPLEPGPPPEIGFAQPPPRRQSYVETIEQNLEKNIEKTPSKHLPGAVRIIPPPLKKEKKGSSKSSSENKQLSSTFKGTTTEKKQYVPESISKPLPNLEPFPFKPDPPRNRPARCPPPPRPSKFVKGSWTESDYESDCDSMRIAVKWNPWQSDSEDYCYRKVKPPTLVATKRPHSATGRAVPPTEFERPPPLQGPSKSIVTQPSEISKSAKSKIIKTEEIHQKSVMTKSVQSKTSGLKPGSPPQYAEAPAPKHKPLPKPGSPPQYAEAPAPKYKPSPKPGSPKVKTKIVQPPADGYMADTDEPSRQFKTSVKTEESVVSRMEQSITMEQKTFTAKTSAKKESSQMEFQSSVVKTEQPPLEPFPFKPDPMRPAKRPMGPPPPSPSKFIKGEFRESDYESEYEGKIKPIWRPGDPPEDMTFRPVKPHLTPVSGKTQNIGRTPTPPTEFDEPPSFNGPPRPKFEPIDKPVPATKVKETVVEKTKLIRPTPVQYKAKTPAPSPVETIYATPAFRPAPEFILKPGSPPRMDYAPPRPGYVEKSNTVNFTESTASSKRVVSVQQTTRVVPLRPQKKENIPPKFLSRESDYDSEVDGVARTPYLDAEMKRLKRVEEMKRKFLESEPPLQPGEPPQFAYSPEPSKLAYSAASKQMTDMTRTFKGKTQRFVSDIMTDIKSNQQEKSTDEPQTYRDENRLSEYGTKQIDPDTGLIYFKYDFGYEFGIVLPGEQKPGAPRKIVSGPSKKEEGAIDFPVIHETTQKKKPAKTKTVKWEPTSESEMSEIESERFHRGTALPPFRIRTPSPESQSPSLKSVSPYRPYGHGSAVSAGSPWLGTGGPEVVRAISPGEQPRKAPLFITPLRDIACVSGHPARFECIVLAEPTPDVVWSKDGSVLTPSPDHQTEYRNGVCRLMLPVARPFNAGQYACTASNAVGSATTSAGLQVPGERRNAYP